MRYYFLSLLLLGVPLFAQDPYTLEARRLSRLASKRAEVHVIAKALKEIDSQLPKHFKHGEINRIDAIALVLGESAFWHKETGDIYKERGLWQIKPDACPSGKDAYQVAFNTELGLRTLKRKLGVARRVRGQMPLKKATIICYNGFNRDKHTGKVNERYWRWFCYNRAKVVKAIGYSKPRTIKYAKRCEKRREIRVIRNSRISNPELARQFELEAARKQLINDVYGGKS